MSLIGKIYKNFIYLFFQELLIKIILNIEIMNDCLFQWALIIMEIIIPKFMVIFYEIIK